MLVLSVLLLALASPAPAGARPAPVPTATQAPNPFTLDPDPGATPLPRRIGGTRSRAICSALRQAVAPAVAAAMTTDKQFGVLRKDVYDYTINSRDTAGGDLRLMQMDNKVQSMVRSTDELDRAIKSNAFVLPRSASSEDQTKVAQIRDALKGVLTAQKVQLDAMSGFVETERMRRFGDATEAEKMILKSVGRPDSGGSTSQTGLDPELSTPHAFLRDTGKTFKSPPGRLSLDDAHNLDHDLDDIQKFVNRRGDAAAKLIIPATNLCK